MDRSTEEIQIKNLSEKRYEFIKKWDDSWNEDKEKYTIEEPKEVDIFGKEILDCIKRWRYTLPFEFIIEELTKLGHAPNILYDDDGRFAITENGIQTVPIENEAIDMDMTFIVEKKYWKDSMRDALNYYLDEK